MKQLKIVLAPDSFKGSLTAQEVCNAMEEGFKKALPDAHYIHVPMADGGEGTLQSLMDANHGEILSREVTGPLGTPVQAKFGYVDSSRLAVIEMAQASGIQYINPQTANPRKATTYGTGELIRACLDLGAQSIILGIGGSATNDGGAGMAQALGVKLSDAGGHELGFGGGELNQLTDIDISAIDPRLSKVVITIACDVKNPLYGPDGASHIYGKQKGASEADIVHLDNCLEHYSRVIARSLKKDVSHIPGAGAGGGIGAGLLAFTHCSMERGVNVVTAATGLEHKLTGADFCITGEGGMDKQTKFGKTPQGVAKAAKKSAVPVIAITGNIGEGAEELYEHGIDVIYSIVPGADSIENLLKDGAMNIERTCENIGRQIRLTMS